MLPTSKPDWEDRGCGCSKRKLSLGMVVLEVGRTRLWQFGPWPSWAEASRGIMEYQ